MIAAAILASGALAQISSMPAHDLAGRYSQSSHVSGYKYHYKLNDIAEIVTVDERHAYVHLHLESFSGDNLCEFAGVAEQRGNALVYVAPRPDDRGAQCTLTVERQGRKLAWSDPNDSCHRYCGPNASLNSGDLPWSSKRPIRHLDRLKQRVDFIDALAEWRTSKPDQP